MDTEPTSVTPWPPSRQFSAQSLPSMDYEPGFNLPMQPLPFDVHQLSPLQSRPSSRAQMSPLELDSDQSQTALSPITLDDFQTQLKAVRKLEDPFNFERDHSRERAPGARSESLLSMRLKDLAFQARRNGVADDI